MKALLTPEPLCVLSDESGPTIEAAIEGMRLEQQVRVGRCMSGKALDRIAGSALHVRERRMSANLEVARKLQRKQEQRFAPDLTQDFGSPAPLGLFPSEFPQPTEAFDNDEAGPVRSIVRKTELPGANGMVMPIGIPGAAAEARSHRRQLWFRPETASLLSEPALVSA